MLIDYSKTNFKKSEFACKGENCCGSSVPMNKTLIESLQKLRELIGKPLYINSGFRCNAHNFDINGSINSTHIHGLAADIHSTCSIPELLEDVKKIPEFINGGIGAYPNFVHVDVRGYRSRW